MMRQFQMVNDPANCDADGVCEAGEDAVNCAADCPHVSGAACGNGLCETGDGEDCLTCPTDCNGDQGGGGGDFCCGNGGVNPIACGIDENDTRCLDASVDRFCRVMPRLPAGCGDLLCEGAETAASCPQDCTVPLCEPTELTDELSCDDGLDNDCDGFVDAADSDCAEPVGGTVSDLYTRIVVCRNLTSGQTVSVPGVVGQVTFDCTAAGFTAAPGDSLFTFVRGSAACAATCAVSEEATGLFGQFAVCRNLTTAQTVTVPLGGGATVDCAAAGLVANKSEEVFIYVRGIAR